MVLKNNYMFNTVSLAGFLIWILMLSLYPYAQDRPGSSIGELTFYLDHASYAGLNGNSTVEFYVMFYSDQLTKQTTTNFNSYEIKLSLIIKNNRNEEISKSSWVTEATADEDDTNSISRVIYDKWIEELQPGEYSINLIAEDQFGQSSGELNTTISVTAINVEEWGISDIEFVTSAEKTYGESHFKKGDLKIIPNPSRRYGIINPKLYFYYEIYGIEINNNDLIINYLISDNSQRVIKQLKDISIKKPGTSATIIHGLDISELLTGVYNLTAIISDSSQSEEIIISRSFEIIQADFFQTNPSLTDEQDRIFNTILSYIGTTKQLEFYRSLNLTGKTEFIVQYWKNLDPEPSTSENEYLNEIQNRFNHAKNKFGWSKVNGWETDRGRICIKYGIPHQVYQYSSEANTSPYEIWIYNESRTYEFIFGDLRSDGRFILIHSNREGEIYNANWREIIQRM